MKSFRITPSRPFAVAITAFLLLWTAGSLSAQYDAPPPPESAASGLDGYPTEEGVLAAVEEGESAGRIIAWIRENGAWFDLTLREALDLRARGVEPPVLAEMTQLSSRDMGSLMAELGYFRPGEEIPGKEALGRRELRKMIRKGAGEEDLLSAFQERGSQIDLKLEEAMALHADGLSPALLAAAAGGILDQPEMAAAGEDAVSLDEILAKAAGEEEEDLEEEPDIWDEQLVAGRMNDLLVLSDTPGSRVSVAPAGARLADLLRMADSRGRTPARVKLSPGEWFVLVEKPLDEFDERVIPALMTVHDQAGRTRTLIENGRIFYDADACCLPRSLSGPFTISRISANQQGLVMGDEFLGLPPYLWDGNGHLILLVDQARVRRIIKVYRITKADGEGRTLVATFVPSSRDPMSVEPLEPVSPESEAAYAEWTTPSNADLDGISAIYGLPRDRTSRIRTLLEIQGKATWASRDSKEGLRLVTLSLDTLSRLRIHEISLGLEGPFGMHATSTVEIPTAEPLTPPTRILDDDLNLPLLTVENTTESNAVLRLEDGAVLYIPAGESRETGLSPSSFTYQVRFAEGGGSPRNGAARFTYHSRYRLAF